MPAGTIFVGRPSKWGNPFEMGSPSGLFSDGDNGALIPSMTRDHAIDFYASALRGKLTPEMYPRGHEWVRWWWSKFHEPPLEAVRELRGHDLCCWCSLDQHCHADVLIELANADQTT